MVYILTVWEDSNRQRLDDSVRLILTTIGTTPLDGEHSDFDITSRKLHK